MDQNRKYSQKKLLNGCTTLMYACQNGLTSKVINEIRNKPQSLYTRDRHNKSALHYCSVRRDPVNAASVMLNAPDLLEAEDEDGFTPLHLAIIQGNLPLVNLLLSQNVNVNALDNEGHSIVHWAVVCGEIDALKACLNAGADISLADVNGASPLHFASQLCGANYEGKSDKASAKLALEILQVILEHPSSKVDEEDKDGRTPLLWAASAGSEKAVLQLVKAGAKVESSDKDGLTALHCAASKGHTSVIDSLVKLCGADVDLIDSNGCSALHYATTLGHADAVSLLLDLGADPNRSDRKGRTPAHCGCNKGQLETIKILGARKGNLWLRNARGDLPIHEACQSGRKELVQWLLEQKPIHVNTANNDGKSLLHIAASNDNADLCKLLIDFGAEANSIYRTPSNVVLTPLDVAVQKGYRNTAKFLQSNGGLPAQKLKITGKRPSLVLSAGSTDSEPMIKPGKFIEKEELYDIKKSKKYVVYVKRSDSISDDEHFRGRMKARSCHHRRRTKSCSGAGGRRYKCCKSRRRHEKNYDSSDEMSSDFEEECMCSDCCLSDESSVSHTKSHQIVCEYKKKRKKKKDKCSKHTEVKASGDSDTDFEKEPKQKGSTKKEPVQPIKGCTHDEEGSKPNSANTKTTKKRPQSAKTATLPKRKSKAQETNSQSGTAPPKNDDSSQKEVTFAVMSDTKPSTIDEHPSDVDTVSDGTYIVEKKPDASKPTEKDSSKDKQSFVMLDDVKDDKPKETLKPAKEISTKVDDEEVEAKKNEKENASSPIVERASDAKVTKKVEFESSIKSPESTATADTPDILNTKKSQLQESLKPTKQSFQVIDDSNESYSEKIDSQHSKEEDSGFEPSPKSARSIRGRKKYGSAVSTNLRGNLYSKKGFVNSPYNYLFQEEKRKPGDRYAVNMSTVTKSIQKNTKRYYMEKKIFQYLLELKGLQMRSNKSNERMIIKRIIDDYHRAVGNEMPAFPYEDYTFKNFELFLYETLRGLQKRGSYNFQNLSEVYREAERRTSVSDLLKSERALQCTTKTHRCLHALHSYTGVPCAAYIPLMNHHTIPKLGFGPLKSTAGRFFLPKILTGTPNDPTDQMDSKKR